MKLRVFLIIVMTVTRTCSKKTENEMKKSSVVKRALPAFLHVTPRNSGPHSYLKENNNFQASHVVQSKSPFYYNSLQKGLHSIPRKSNLKYNYIQPMLKGQDLSKNNLILKTHPPYENLLCKKNLLSQKAKAIHENVVIKNNLIQAVRTIRRNLFLKKYHLNRQRILRKNNFIQATKNIQRQQSLLKKNNLDKITKQMQEESLLKKKDLIKALKDTERESLLSKYKLMPAVKTTQEQHKRAQRLHSMPPQATVIFVNYPYTPELPYAPNAFHKETVLPSYGPEHYHAEKFIESTKQSRNHHGRISSSHEVNYCKTVTRTLRMHMNRDWMYEGHVVVVMEQREGPAYCSSHSKLKIQIHGILPGGTYYLYDGPSCHVMAQMIAMFKISSLDRYNHEIEAPNLAKHLSDLNVVKIVDTNRHLIACSEPIYEFPSREILDITNRWQH